MSSSRAIAWTTLLAATLLSGCGDKTPAGFTGRVGADFRAEMDVTLDGVPLHLVHHDRCLEYRMGTGFDTTLSYDPIMLSDIGGFSARQGRWRLLSTAPNMCNAFNNQLRRKGNSVLSITIPAEEQSSMPPKPLRPNYLPLLALRPDDDGPLRLYLSEAALNRPGDPLRFGGITGVVPAAAGAPVNTEPLPLRAMLHGTVPGTCYRGWVLSPAHPKVWSAMPEAAAFMAAASRPTLVPGQVAAKLDPWFDRPSAAQWHLWDLGISDPPAAFEVNAETFVVQGARSLAMVHEVEEGLIFDTVTFTDWKEWRYGSMSMVHALTGWGLPSPPTLPRPDPDGYQRRDFGGVMLDVLIPLRRAGAAYRPVPAERGLAEAWPGDAQCGNPLEGEIPVALGRDTLSLQSFAIFAWPEAGTFARLVPVDIRLPN